MKISILRGRYQISLFCRGLSFLFRKNWYSLYRWKNPTEFDDYSTRILDVGMFGVSFYRRLVR